MISSIYEAVPIVMRTMDKYRLFGCKSIRFASNHKHAIVEDNKNQIFWVLFKRGFFNSFATIFGKVPANEPGESVNKEVLEEALKLKVLQFVFVYENEDIFAVSPKELKLYCELEKTIRTTDAGETTYSVPISMLEKW